MIRELSYDEVKDIKIETYGVDIVESGIYYGLFNDGKLVSFVNILHYKTLLNLEVFIHFLSIGIKGTTQNYFSILSKSTRVL